MSQRSRPRQFTTLIDGPSDSRLYDQAVRIAALRGEHDRSGRGLSAVLRRYLRRYVAQHRHLLEDELERDGR